MAFTATALALLLGAWRLEAQAPLIPLPPECDSVVAAAKVDSIPVGIFVRVARLDGALQAGHSRFIAEMIATAFIPPRPFRLSVFSGAPQMRVLRRMAPDTVGELRPPSITGIYRLTTT